MNRYDIIDKIGRDYLTSNIEAGEYSYLKEASSKEKLQQLVGHKVDHFKLDILSEYSNSTRDVRIWASITQAALYRSQISFRRYIQTLRLRSFAQYPQRMTIWHQLPHPAEEPEILSGHPT